MLSKRFEIELVKGKMKRNEGFPKFVRLLGVV